MFIEIIKQDDDLHTEEPEVGENARTKESEVQYFDVLPTRSELAYHKYLMGGPIPSIFMRNPIITKGCLSNLKLPCIIRHVHVEKAYIDLNSPLNIVIRMMYNWIMRRKLDPRENSDRGVSNFTGRIKGIHIFVENFTYVTDFMIVEDISSIIDPRLSQLILGKPFVEISNMTHDLPEEKEHTKLFYLRNEEDRRRGVEYVMSKILGFYKQCLELGPEYMTGVDDEGEATCPPDDVSPITYWRNKNKAKDYSLAHVPFTGGQWAVGDEPLYYVVSSKDVVIAKPRDAEDHIKWLLQHGWHEKDLASIEAGHGRSELLDENLSVEH
uniref:Vacuolar protein sorting-associated protein 41 homolog n=1 Tax=Tanacetum cinerariifolium TaxID=118510 RepID=A0A6L2KCD1_TANCI|nr:vacuolar protein sorting-associated protein 41 homolog [Tanacetum cinerariifolium]